MNAHVFFILLNKLGKGKEIKCYAFLSLINSLLQEHGC